MDIPELILYSFVAYVLPRVVPALARVFLHVHVLRGDRLAKLPNLVVIMTSNCTAGYEPYIRHGRVDVTLGRGQARQPGDHIRMFFCVHPRNDARDDVADDLPGRFVIIDEPARDT
jgi:hypothetical protein